MSKIKIFILSKVQILIFLSFQVVAEEFVYGLGDIPIFKEMKSIEDSYVLFDKVDGRYLYSEIKGDYEVLEIQEYYKKVLIVVPPKDIALFKIFFVDFIIFSISELFKELIFLKGLILAS